MNSNTHFTPEVWPTDNVVTFVPASTPPDLPVTAVKIYVFQDDALLLAKVDRRGWDLPGGHIEPGETPAVAITRELKEETGGTVSRFAQIGYLKIINEGPSRTGKKYPPTSCILIYKGTGVSFDSNHSFPHLEITDAKFIPYDRLPATHHDWSKSKKEVIDYALSV